MRLEFYLTSLLTINSCFKIDWNNSINEILKHLAGADNLKLFLADTADTNITITEDVKFFCRDRNNNSMNQISIDDKNLNQKLNLTKKVAFIVHGWVDSISGFWVNETISQWLKYQDINICIVDWNRLSSYEYTTAASKNTRLVGRYIADFLIFLVSKGLQLNSTTIVGHSLGGQIAGFTGAALNGELGQIIALDPAGPLFTFPTLFSINDRLDKTDAKWVQVLHTSSNILGVQINCGHQDFYPNAGIVPQAGCILPFISDAPNKKIVTCSHLRAAQYFVSSLNPEIHCRGSNCPSYLQWFSGLCWDGIMDNFGIYSKRVPGTFWFSTSLKAPHCTGYS